MAATLRSSVTPPPPLAYGLMPPGEAPSLALLPFEAPVSLGIAMLIVTYLARLIGIPIPTAHSRPLLPDA